MAAVASVTGKSIIGPSRFWITVSHDSSINKRAELVELENTR
jgi:hypothetical protein